MFPIPATSDWSMSVSPNVRVPSATAGARAWRRAAADARGCPARGVSARGRAARAPARSIERPPLVRRAARATGCRRAARRAAARTSGRSSAGASAGRRRPRTGSAGSCRSPRPIRACVRPPSRRPASPARADSATRRRSAGRRAPAADAPRGATCRPRARFHGNEIGKTVAVVTPTHPHPLRRCRRLRCPCLGGRGARRPAPPAQRLLGRRAARQVRHAIARLAARRARHARGQRCGVRSRVPRASPTP